tara:strand:+ start:725 stop:835 length:111 start_codon:yes stop_codon:yes gene_type:complete
MMDEKLSNVFNIIYKEKVFTEVGGVRSDKMMHEVNV